MMKNRTNISIFVGLLIVVFYTLGIVSNSNTLKVENEQGFSYTSLVNQHSPNFESLQTSLTENDLNAKEIEEEENDEKHSDAVLRKQKNHYFNIGQTTQSIANALIDANQFHFLYLLFENFRL